MAKKPFNALAAAGKKSGKGKAAKSKAGKPKKASNTTPVDAVSPNNQRQSITIRKIANGYVTSKSGYSKGQYVERETFSRTAPRVVVSGEKK